MSSRVQNRVLDRGARSRLLRKDKEGVASTVGTIMALLVFIAFMALITNSYVPAWMMDNERAHMNQVTDQFGELKGKVDSMVVQWTIRGGLSSNMYAPIALGSAGVPLFATPTIGILTYSPVGSSGSSISMSFTPDGSKAETIEGGGRVELYCPNRYYVQQWLVYENGAIIMGQEDGQTMRACPNLEFSKVGEKVNIHFTQIDQVGDSQSRSGSDSVGLNIELIYVDMQSYTLNGEWTLTLNTAYGMAWENYLKESLGEVGLEESTGYELNRVNSQTEGITTITLTINNPNTLFHDRATVRMSGARG